PARPALVKRAPSPTRPRVCPPTRSCGSSGRARARLTPHRLMCCGQGRSRSVRPPSAPRRRHPKMQGATMKALLCRKFGPPESLTVEDVPSPTAGPGQIVVSVAAAGVNFPDILITQGKYQFKPTLPFSPGSELAGTVKETGAGVTEFQIGDTVMAQTLWGAFA